MADALLSPAVGVTFWTASGAALSYCGSKIKKTLDDHKVPMMGVLGAFIFAAQMINFTIPGTGSSGHLGGGLLLSLLLGPYAAFLTISSVLVIQAFFFADGGLLALGTNIFNLGVFPCFFGLPIFRLIAGKNPSSGRLAAASIGAAAVSLEMGAMGVVLETLFSGRSELAFVPFVALMGGIHLPIGIIEGVVTAAVLGYVLKLRPELAAQALGTAPEHAVPPRSLAPVLASFAVAALLSGGFLAWFASTRPEGLEWSSARVTSTGGGTDSKSSPADHGLPGKLAKIQQRTAFLPDYTLPAKDLGEEHKSDEQVWPAVNKGSSIAGFVGAILTLVFAGFLGFVLTRRRKKTETHT
jgi:cobalt/nickel transport system permease protein